jgi:rod shape-determining protein MreC
MAILMMVLDQQGIGVQQIRSALSMPLSMLEYGVSYPVQLIDKLGSTISTHDALVKESIDLKTEQLLLKAQVQRLLAIESENNQLKALLRSSAQVRGKVLIAQLLAVDSDPFVNQVILDKGLYDGVFIGQPVLDANGVMGKVIQIGPITSRVLLINDSHSGVPIQTTRNGIRAIAVGDSYSGKLRLVNVPQTVDIKEGDMLVTSGLGENYPAGYPVGQVINVVKDPGMQFATIDVQPSAHADRSRQVLLVWPNQNQKIAEAAVSKQSSANLIINKPLPAHEKSAGIKAAQNKSEPNKVDTHKLVPVKAVAAHDKPDITKTLPPHEKLVSNKTPPAKGSVQ